MSCDSRHVLSLLILVLCSCCSLPTLEFIFSDCQRITHLLKFHLSSFIKSAWSPFHHQKLCILFLNSWEILYFTAVNYQILQRYIHVLLYGKLSEGRNHIYIFLNSVLSTVWCGIGMYKVHIKGKSEWILFLIKKFKR